MNHSVETAQESTGKVTAKALLAVLKAGTTTMGLHCRAVTDRPSYSDAWIFEVIATKEVTDRETFKVTSSVQHRIEVPGWVTNGHTSTREGANTRLTHARYTDAYRPSRGHWYFGPCTDRLTDILDMLPSDADISFKVALDGHTTPLLVAADSGSERGLHADALYLVASVTKRGKTHERKFLVDVRTGAHNSARFGQEY